MGRDGARAEPQLTSKVQTWWHSWSLEAAADRALDLHRTSHAVEVADLLNKNRAARRVCKQSRYCPMLTPGQARTMTRERLDLDTTVSNATALPSRETRKVGSMKPP